MTMSALTSSRFISALGALTLACAPVTASVRFIGNDYATNHRMRDAAVVKLNDGDADNIYGTMGFYIARPGGDGGDRIPFLQNSNDLLATPGSFSRLPAFITGFVFSDANERGRSWGGAGWNYGVLEHTAPVANANTFTGASILLAKPPYNGPLALSLRRSDSPAFRLTLIFGNSAVEAGNNPAGQQVTMNDGSGAISQPITQEANTYHTTYQTWEISAGASPIDLVIQSLSRDNTRLSGIAIDRAFTDQAPDDSYVSLDGSAGRARPHPSLRGARPQALRLFMPRASRHIPIVLVGARSEEHTSELQSQR